MSKKIRNSRANSMKKPLKRRLENIFKAITGSGIASSFNNILHPASNSRIINHLAITNNIANTKITTIVEVAQSLWASSIKTTYNHENT